MILKKCINFVGCGKTWNESSMPFKDDVCTCGFRLKPVPTESMPDEGQGDLVYVTPDGQVLLPGDSRYPASDSPAPGPEPLPEPLAAPEIAVFVGGFEQLTFPLDTDEIVVGRKDGSSEPDVDLSRFDSANCLSRKHLLLHRLGGNCYARNLSERKTVHFDEEPLAYKEQRELSDGDQIVLGKLITLEVRFLKASNP